MTVTGNSEVNQLKIYPYHMDHGTTFCYEKLKGLMLFSDLNVLLKFGLQIEQQREKQKNGFG